VTELRAYLQHLGFIAFSLFVVLTQADEHVPRVIIVAQNSGSEITDLLVPFAILSEAGMDVEILSTEEGPVNLMNGMELLGLRTLKSYGDKRVDLVVIPAVHFPNQKKLIEWLDQIYERGAMLASICDGVEVLASAGLLNGRRATGHFYSMKRRESNYPKVNWVENVRYIHDGRAFSTAGVSASIPAAVYLVEHMLGSDVAKVVAQHYGVDRSNSSHHNSGEFAIGAKEVFVGVRNYVLGFSKTRYNIKISPLVDEYLLALTIDALGRTYRTSITLDMENPEVTTMRGLKFRSKPVHKSPHWIVQLYSGPADQEAVNTLIVEGPSQLFQRIFQHIESAFGRDSAEFVATQLELSSTALSFE